LKWQAAGFRGAYAQSKIQTQEIQRRQRSASPRSRTGRAAACCARHPGQAAEAPQTQEAPIGRARRIEETPLRRLEPTTPHLVILSEAKNLSSICVGAREILRFAQNDNWCGGRFVGNRKYTVTSLNRSICLMTLLFVCARLKGRRAGLKAARRAPWASSAEPACVRRRLRPGGLLLLNAARS
jgi:hypothetical protein